MADAKGKKDPVTFRYTFRFDSGEEKVIRLALDPKTLELLEPQHPADPDPATLGFCQSRTCPLWSSERPTCPAAIGLEDLVNTFTGHPATEEVDVSIETPARTYVKRTSLQQSVTSLVGIFMVASGCRTLGKLKPMVRYHLPFATLEETQYRVLSMYLLAQYFRVRQKQVPDWKLSDLVQMYRDFQAVNEHFVKRLSHLNKHDPSINALVILEAFSYAIAFSIDRHLLDEVELLFTAYLETTK